jgi:hypothetical protein
MELAQTLSIKSQRLSIAAKNNYPRSGDDARRSDTWGLRKTSVRQVGVIVASTFGSGVGHAVVPLPSGGDTYFTFLLFGDSSHEVFGIDNVRVTGDPVPEPGSLLLLDAGLLGLCSR